MSEEKSLYVPRKLKDRREFIRGFGQREIIQSAIFLAIAAFLDIIIWSITESVVTVVVFMMVAITVCYFLFAVDQFTNMNLIDNTRNLIRFLRSQKKIFVRTSESD